MACTGLAQLAACEVIFTLFFVLSSLADRVLGVPGLVLLKARAVSFQPSAALCSNSILPIRQML